MLIHDHEITTTREREMQAIAHEIAHIESQRAGFEQAAASEIARALRCTEALRKLKADLFKLQQEDAGNATR